MKKGIYPVLGLCVLLCLVGCSSQTVESSAGGTQVEQSSQQNTEREESMWAAEESYTVDTKIQDVINDPAFGEYGRLIFPVDSGYFSGETLGDLRLTWYNNIDPNKTVEIVNYLKEHAEAGDIVFYDIYSEEEKIADPDKNDTGLFFFRGEPGEKFAVCNAGGGFAYVGAMQDSFPHALELFKRGYNAFAQFTALERRQPARTWPGLSALFLNMPKSFKWIRIVIPSGVDPQAAEWQHGSALMARRLLVGTAFPNQARWLCNIQGILIIQRMIRLPLPA